MKRQCARVMRNTAVFSISVYQEVQAVMQAVQNMLHLSVMTINSVTQMMRGKFSYHHSAMKSSRQTIQKHTRLFYIHQLHML